MTGIYSILQFQKFIVCVGSQDKIAENPISNSEMTWPNTKSYDELTTASSLIERNIDSHAELIIHSSAVLQARNAIIIIRIS